MNTWFVATVDRLPGRDQFHFIWAPQEFASESAARLYAKEALNRGLRVEAGTLPALRPEIRVRWREAAAWVASEQTRVQAAEAETSRHPRLRLRRRDEDRRVSNSGANA